MLRRCYHRDRSHTLGSRVRLARYLLHAAPRFVCAQPWRPGFLARPYAKAPPVHRPPSLVHTLTLVPLLDHSAAAADHPWLLATFLIRRACCMRAGSAVRPHSGVTGPHSLPPASSGSPIPCHPHPHRPSISASSSNLGGSSPSYAGNPVGWWSMEQSRNSARRFRDPKASHWLQCSSAATCWQKAHHASCMHERVSQALQTT